MDAYLLLVSLGSGVISVAIVLFEISFVRRFIFRNQNLEMVPKIVENETEKKINKYIREFRKFIFSRSFGQNETLASFRKKLSLLRYLMIIFFGLMFIMLFISYMLSRNYI